MIKVSCYDYGAYGEVKADALVSYYFEDTKTRELDWWGPGEGAKVPKDDDANFIADACQWNNGRAKDDKDFPPLYGAPGDGLSRYEEYRGFMVQGEHIRTNPNEKDVFILDKAG